MIENIQTDGKIQAIINYPISTYQIGAIFGPLQPLEIIESKNLIPFENPQIGDQVKPI